MSMLSNQRHERFAQELAKGKTADEAYVIAGYKPDRGNAARLTANDSIATRVCELQERASSGLNVTLQWLMEKAEEARVVAMEQGQASAAVAAIKEIGILSGKRVEKVQQTKAGDLEHMTDAELTEIIRGRNSTH